MRVVFVLLLLLFSCRKQIEDPFEAVFENDLYSVRYWLEHGGDPNIKNESGCPLLIWSLQAHVHSDIKILIIEHGADPNCREPDGCHETALMTAANLLELSTCRALLAAGADPNLKDDKGRDALWWIGDSGGSETERKIEWLLKAAMRK